MAKVKLSNLRKPVQSRRDFVYRWTFRDDAKLSAGESGCSGPTREFDGDQNPSPGPTGLDRGRPSDGKPGNQDSGNLGNFGRGVPVVMVRRDVKKGTEWRLHAGHRFWTESLPWEVLSWRGSQWGLVCYVPHGHPLYSTSLDPLAWWTCGNSSSGW